MKEDEIVAAIKEAPHRLSQVQNQTETICLTAVHIDGRMLQYVNNQTEVICIAAVSNNTECLQWVQEETPTIALAAVSLNWESLALVRNQTKQICLAAISQNANALRYVRDQSEDLCLAAIAKDYRAIRHVREASEFITQFAVLQNGAAIDLLSNKTTHLCQLAMTTSGYGLKYFDKPTRDQCLLAVKLRPSAIHDVPDDIIDPIITNLAIQGDASLVIDLAIRNNPNVIISDAELADAILSNPEAVLGRALRRGYHINVNVLVDVVKRNWQIIQFIHAPVYSVVSAAINQDPDAILHIDQELLSEDLLIKAVLRGAPLSYIDDQTTRLCFLVSLQDNDRLEEIRDDRTRELISNVIIAINDLGILENMRYQLWKLM